MRTRFAPTPSGLLHAGNAWSFLLTWLLARSGGGTIHLRIDDLDAARLREEYVEDIFASLRWLGLDWDTGPRDLADVKGSHGQRARLDRYRIALDRLADLGPVDVGPAGSGLDDSGPRNAQLLYACACSREKVKRDSREAGRPGIYPGTCRDAGIPWRAGFDDRHPAKEAFPLRVRVPSNAEVTIAGIMGDSARLHPGRDIGDFVVWQRNGEPAYQLASLVDDEEMGMDLIVRGQDLRPSTGAQAWMAGLLGFGTFREARFLHHGLLSGSHGEKLSKSEGAVSLRSMRERLGSPAPLLAFFARRLGIEVAETERPPDLLAGFAPERIPEGPLFWEELVRETGMA